MPSVDETTPLAANDGGGYRYLYNLRYLFTLPGALKVAEVVLSIYLIYLINTDLVVYNGVWLVIYFIIAVSVLFFVTGRLFMCLKSADNTDSHWEVIHQLYAGQILLYYSSVLSTFHLVDERYGFGALTNIVSAVLTILFVISFVLNYYWK